MKTLILLAMLIQSVAHAESYSPSLIGGREVQKDEIPEVIRIRSGNAYCTASLISGRVIMTAAHCTSEKGEIVPVEEKIYEFVKDQKVYKAKCELAPDYKGVTGDQDMALCLVDKEVDGPYAIVSEKKVELGAVLSLIGYGCIRSENPRGGNDGILRIGEAKVVREASKDYYSIHTKGASALCFGDSGGPAFQKIEDLKNEDHYVVGVNSRGDIKELSLLTSLAHEKSQKFFRDFEIKNGVKICGISKDCSKHKEPRGCASEMAELKIAVQRLDQCMKEDVSFLLPALSF